MTFAGKQGEWDEPVMVTVNGKAYPTQMYDGVQRFIPDPDVEELVRLSIDNCALMGIGREARRFYAEIPESLKTTPHPNAVVRFMVHQNSLDYYGLNELSMSLHMRHFTLQDMIEFETLHGWSVSGFYDSVTSKISNLGLATLYIDDEDGEEYEDYSAHLTISNPLWED